MLVNRRMLQQYLVSVAVNLGLMNESTAKGIEEFDRRTFANLLEARIEHLRVEAKSESAFFAPEYYTNGVDVVSQVLQDLDEILGQSG